MALATSSARARLSSRLMLARPARYKRLRRTTTTPTIDVTPRTCFPLMPSRMALGFGLQTSDAWLKAKAKARSQKPGALLILLRSQPQPVQLIVQRLEADA